jgi:outer membrane protein insertion porin family
MTAQNPPTYSHFVRFTGKISAYFKLPWRFTLALSLGAGYNLQLTADSKTYPDRLFFLGGVDSVRSYLADSLIPEDQASKIKGADTSLITIRGGDFMLNPRVELRMPITEFVQLGAFVDAGNVWTDPTQIKNPLQLHYGVGPGLRLITPVGPVAFDLGINPSTRLWEISDPFPFGWAFHFSIGLF